MPSEVNIEVAMDRSCTENAQELQQSRKYYHHLCHCLCCSLLLVPAGAYVSTAAYPHDTPITRVLRR